LLDDLVCRGIDARRLTALPQTALYTMITSAAAHVSSEKWSDPDPPDSWLRIAGSPEGDALVDALARCHATRWWADRALDRAQLWIGPNDASPQPSDPSTRSYGRPTAVTWTSSALDDGSSAWWHLLREGADGPPPETTQSVWRLTPQADARVYEITTAEDWAELCEAFAFVMVDGYVGPDWAAVANEYDGVHLTVEGLIRAQCVEVETAYGTAKLDNWDAESTAWLRWCFGSVERVGELEPVSSHVSTPVRHNPIRRAFTSLRARRGS
jgi:hypothetical protein